MAAPAPSRNSVDSVIEWSGRADTTSVAGEVDEEVEVPNTGDASQVNLIHTFDYKIHHSYLI